MSGSEAAVEVRTASSRHRENAVDHGTVVGGAGNGVNCAMKSGMHVTRSAVDEPVSRRTLLIGAAGLVLLAPAVRPLAPTATAAAPTFTYGHGYTGGY